MSSISGLGSSQAWASMGPQRSDRPPGGADPAKFKQDLFNKLDADGSGGVDSSEIDKLLTKVSQRSGSTATTDNATSFSQMDGDGDGSLSADELDSGLKSLIGTPGDTAGFVRSRGAQGGHSAEGAHRGPPPGPPPAEAAEAGDATEASEATEGTEASSDSSTATDPLDTNGDGTVSATERAVGDIKQALQDLKTAIDTDGDSKISRSEVRQFAQVLQQLGTQSGAQAGGQAGGQSQGSQSADNSSSRGHHQRLGLADQVMRHYAQASANAAESGLSSSLSEAA